MQRIELSWKNDFVLHCPFCGHACVTEESLDTCEHTLFHASDHGFEYVNKKLEITEADAEEIEVSGEGFDEYTDNLKVNDGIKFALYTPAPSFMGSYVGFGPLE